MSYEFTVQVLDKKQEEVPDVDVEVYIFMGAWTGKGGSLEATTNSDGYAEFER